MIYKINFDIYNAPKRNQDYQWNLKQELYPLGEDFKGIYKKAQSIKELWNSFGLPHN